MANDILYLEKFKEYIKSLNLGAKGFQLIPYRIGWRGCEKMYEERRCENCNHEHHQECPLHEEFQNIKIIDFACNFWEEKE